MAYPRYRIVGGINSVIREFGVPVQIAPIALPTLGGLIFNPVTPRDQGIRRPESLYVSIVRPPHARAFARLRLDEVTEVVPGQAYIVPANCYVWALGATVGHRFTSMFYVPALGYAQPDPVPGMPGYPGFEGIPFPPNRPTGMTKVIPSYVYQEYTDDDDIMAFAAAQNGLQQNYIDTFNALNLPIYPNALIKGALADWVLKGVYGFTRPILYAARSLPYGILNSYGPNWNVAINMVRKRAPAHVVVADDDTYKRCVTWHYQKGDGKYFNIRWLKRRVMRFLNGVNGSSPPIDSTNQISVTFGPNFECTIRIVLRARAVIGGAVLNMFGGNGTNHHKRFNDIPLNTQMSRLTRYPALPFMTELQEAISTGVLELPFQFQFKVVVG